MTITIPVTYSNPAINSNRLKKTVCGSTSFISSINNIKNNNNSIWKKLVSFINRIRFTSDRKANIKFIERHFKLPDSYKKEIFHDQNTTSIMIKKEYKKYLPSKADIKASEDLHAKNSVTEHIHDTNLCHQFNIDFHRVQYYLHTPYRQENKQKIKDSRFLSAKFGLENAQFISQVSHQGLLNEIAMEFNLFNIKNELSLCNNRSTHFIVTETQQGNCIITAKSEMEAINIKTSKIIKGVTVSITRKTFFIKGKDGLFLENHDKKDQLAFVITKKYSSTNPW
nr:hypothetical protein [Providencia stuartii]